MAMGAWRISKARVLTRRAAAIETLGSATVLCTDKTGTLTENRMSIAELRVKNEGVWRPSEALGAQLPEAFHELVEFGVLASAPDPFDPMEQAFHDLGRGGLAETEHLHGREWKLIHTYGCAQIYLPCRRCGTPPGVSKGSSSPPKVLLKPSLIFAISMPRMWPR
jgi:Ca2+-transporting ATPase